MEKSKILVIIGLVVIIVVVLLAVGIKKEEKTISNTENTNVSTEMVAQNNIANDTNSTETKTENEETEKNTVSENTTKEETTKNETTKKESNTDYKPATSKDSTNSNDSTVNINGKYKNYLETEGSYYRSDLVIKNSSKDSIDFELSTAHGRDVDHVNIGDLSKTAKKIDVPEDMKIPDSTQYAYEYKDVTDGEINRIIFVYTAHRQFEYISIAEDYATPDFNPFAGHGVFFSGDYEKDF